ncbi:MAG: DNA polymerase III subunit beta [Bacteroidales bacterium]|nr:DNA polymerase III subunit beta [Bacteroidales bacterium]
MKFTVSSSELLHGLLSVSRVISNRNTLPILDNFLFVLSGNSLEVTASDLEMTLKTTIAIEDVQEEGEIAVPAKLLTDSLKEFPDLPLQFSTEANEEILNISWMSGASKIPFFPADDYPSLPELGDLAISASFPSDILLTGINNTIYATAEDELRPVMNGIFFDMTPENTTLVATDSHKLVYYTRHDVKVVEKCSFILPKKPAAILRSLLGKSEDLVKVTFDTKNAYFEFDGNILICRLQEGTYPAYRSVIPKNNPNKLVINRVALLNAVKRVAVCSNQSTSHIKLSLSFNKLVISASDTNFSMSAHETLDCTYEGDEMHIGFKSTFLAEILNNLPYEEVSIELSDPTRAGLILAAGETDPEEVICSLLMPIRIPS